MFMQSIPDCQEQNKQTAYLPQAVVGAVAIQEGSLPEVVNIKKLLAKSLVHSGSFSRDSALMF